jgi:hypothetical protein
MFVVLSVFWFTFRSKIAHGRVPRVPQVSPVRALVSDALYCCVSAGPTFPPVVPGKSPSQTLPNPSWSSSRCPPVRVQKVLAVKKAAGGRAFAVAVQLSQTWPTRSPSVRPDRVGDRQAVVRRIADVVAVRIRPGHARRPVLARRPGRGDRVLGGVDLDQDVRVAGKKTVMSPSVKAATRVQVGRFEVVRSWW